MQMKWQMKTLHSFSTKIHAYNLSNFCDFEGDASSPPAEEQNVCLCHSFYLVDCA